MVDLYSNPAHAATEPSSATQLTPTVSNFFNVMILFQCGLGCASGSRALSLLVGWMVSPIACASDEAGGAGALMPGDWHLRYCILPRHRFWAGADTKPAPAWR